MKQPTLDYILNLRNAILARTEEIKHLTRLIEEMRSHYSAMAPNQLNEAIRDVVGMHKQIEAHKAFCEHAQKEVDAYFASPAVA